MRRRFIEPLVAAMLSTALAGLLPLREVGLLAIGTLFLLEFWNLLDRLVSHRRTPWVFRSTGSDDPLDEALVDYRYYRTVAHEAPTLLGRLSGLSNCISVVTAHSLIGLILNQVRHDLARVIAAMALAASIPTMLVAVSYYRTPSQRFVEPVKDLAVANGIVAISLFMWFLIAVKTKGSPRSPLLTLASLTLAVTMTRLGSTIGLHEIDELQTLVPGMNCYSAGLLLFHLSGSAFRPVLWVRLASAVICGGASWIAWVEFYNGLTVSGVSGLYNGGVFAVGLVCAFLAMRTGRLSTRPLPPPAVAKPDGGRR